MSIFSNSVETRELHKKDQLRTRYYRNNFDQIVKAFEKICQEEDMQLQQTNKQFGDIYICAYDYEVFVTVVQVLPMEASIDLKVNYFSTFGFGKPEKKVLHLYDRLNKMLVFKGVSLHPNAK